MARFLLFDSKALLKHLKKSDWLARVPYHGNLLPDENFSHIHSWLKLKKRKIKLTNDDDLHKQIDNAIANSASIALKNEYNIILVMF